MGERKEVGAETIELKADLLEPQAEPQQHNTPATSEDSSKATSVELASENVEQPNPSADQAQEPISTADEDSGEAANDLITEQPSEDADSKAGAETIELKADLLEPQAEPQQHNNPATNGDSSKATSVELAGENVEQPHPSADQAQEPISTAEEDSGEAANDLITEEPSEDTDSKAGAETIELKADLLEPQAEPQQHNNPATSEDSSKATSVELADENVEQPHPSADQAQESASTSLDDTLPVVEADILDPEPLPSPIDSSSAVSVIESLDEVDALIADGRN